MHDDRDIIKAIRRQPEQGFRQLLQYYQKPVYWYARRMVVAEQAIKERFERSQQLLDLREKYYEEYSKILTQKQIQRVYELERQAMNRLEKHHRHGHKAPAKQE